MFESVEELLEFMNSINYCEFINLQAPLVTYITLQGSCHDQTVFELQELYNLGLTPKAKFIITVDENGQGLETHSFAYFEFDSSWYWFENAWKDMRGIHEFDTFEEMIDTIMQSFAERLDYDSLYIADFVLEEHSIGEDLDTLVDVCMNSAKEYNL